MAKVGALAWGPHKHRFSASDGTHEVFTQWEQGPKVQGDDPIWNQPPDLENAQVKPQYGGPDTEFSFKVRYNDDDNDPPSTIQLLLDGKAYDMVQVKSSNAYYKGVYYQVSLTGLSWGPHSYAFTASRWSTYHDHYFRNWAEHRRRTKHVTTSLRFPVGMLSPLKEGPTRNLFFL